jgi:hypothetical protein
MTTTRDVIQTGENLTPDSVSPVLKTNVTIQLPTDFPYTLDKADFSVNATDVSNSSYIRFMNVIDADDDAKTITCKFGGAESGTFRILIRHSATGIIESDGLMLDVNAYVDSYSPTSGSIYGGTLLTIDGRNFGDVYTDNPVQISTNGGVDSIDCYVEETSATQIKCRIDTDIVAREAALEGAMVVFLKTSEEATCDSTVCAWTYTGNIPNITAVVASFDTTSLDWIVTVTGTDLSGDTSTTDLRFGGISQTTTSVSTTEAVFTINNITS